MFFNPVNGREEEKKKAKLNFVRNHLCRTKLKICMKRRTANLAAV